MRISRTASVLTAAFLGGEKSDETPFVDITFKKILSALKEVNFSGKTKKRSDQQMHRQALTSVELQG